MTTTSTKSTSHSSRAGRVWLITGASRGIGLELARAVVAAGDRVVATGRNAADVAARLGAHDDLLAVALDVTDAGSITAAVDAAIARFGRIDVLVNNAGFGVIGAVEETSDDDIRRVYETNVFGLLAVTRTVLPTMRAQRSGHVVNISSVGGYASAAGYGVYCSTKFAVEALSESLHAELQPLGIAVTVVEPGYFRTDFLAAQSVVTSPTVIADYAATAGQTRKTAQERNGTQQGDPAKLATSLVQLVRSETPPLRLPLGTDTVAAIEAKNAFVAAELAAWRSIAISTDHTA